MPVTQKHILVIEDDQGRREFVLDQPEYSIGRDPKCSLRIMSQFVSRHHANLIRCDREDGGSYYQIVDGDDTGKPSVNGLMINGHKEDNYTLQNEDVVVFGPQVKATYYTSRTDPLSAEQIDEFDITLISPGMIEEFPE
jgi:pSer/pThr/pTyr-binding forkhead associated (FHA) protein